jgi:hypothetical protein
MSLAQTITLDAEKVLKFIQSVMPVVEGLTGVGASVSNPVSLGMSAASIILPLVSDMIAQLEAQGVIDPATQQARLDAVQKALTDFTGPEWKPSMV